MYDVLTPLIVAFAFLVMEANIKHFTGNTGNELIEILEQREMMGKMITVYGTYDDPLFLAKDVAGWIEHSNSRSLLQLVDDEEKVVNKVYTLGGIQESWLLTENGLYEVLMQSRKPIAKDFKKIIKVILKEIRTKGGYISTYDSDTPEMIMARALKIADSTIEKNKQIIKQLEIQTKLQSEEILRSKPLIDLANECYISTESMTASIMSARLGFKSAVSFNNFLKANGIQYKLKGDKCWKLTAKYSGNGYTKTIPYPYTKSDGTIGTQNSMEWTEAGFVFVRNLINKKQIAS